MFVKRSGEISIKALQSGQPVLGCARPSCFGWGVKTDKGARFYRIHRKNDGFMRRTDLKKYDKAKTMARESQLAFCEKNYASSSCDENMQWVGGLSPSSNITTQPLLLKCCTFDNLKNSWDRGIADVNPGQIVVGGEVMKDERQYAFDYIANIKKYSKKNGSITYSVTIRRFWCLPYPTKSNLYGKIIEYLKYLETLHRSGLSISPIKDFTSTVTQFTSTNQQQQSMMPLDSNQYLDASSIQNIRYVPQQSFIQQQEAQLYPSIYESYSQMQPQQQHHAQSLLYEQQMPSAQQFALQQSVPSHSSQFPLFPSFDQLV
uniref:BMA-WRT-2 n=1 Tax=Brugia malayi TaxID=6279 RepID=A0A0H5RZB4_BRUMA|nr:BMA-WRT-2 [Brugia malayi]